MTFDRMALIATLAALFLGAIFLLKWRQGVALRRAAEVARQENFRRQEFLLIRLGSIANLLGNKGLAVAELRSQAELLFAEMEAENVEGDIDALIADTRLQLEEEVARRPAFVRPLDSIVRPPE